MGAHHRKESARSSAECVKQAMSRLVAVLLLYSKLDRWAARLVEFLLSYFMYSSYNEMTRYESQSVLFSLPRYGAVCRMLH